jgi:hypothetical protein
MGGADCTTNVLGCDAANLITNGNGVLSFPVFINQTGDDVSGTINPHHEFDGNGTSTFFYYDYATEDFPRTGSSINVTRGKTASGDIYLGNRFVAEDENNTIPTTINRTLSQGLNLIGNPFMSHLDFGKLYLDNTSIIQPYFKIWKGTSIYTVQVDGQGGYVSTNPSDEGIGDALIAPMQAFFVESVNGGPLAIKVADVSTTKSGGATLRSAVESAGESLKIVARSDKGASAIVLCRESAEEDSFVPKVFTPFEEMPEIFIAGETAGEIGNISKSLTSLPVGIRAFDGDAITLTFKGLERLSAEVNLYDSKEDALIPLSASANTYSFVNDESNMRNRFLVLFNETGITGFTSAETSSAAVTISRSKGMFTIVASPLDEIRSVKVFNLHGQLIEAQNNLSAVSWEVNVGEKGVYVIDVITKNTRCVKKVVNY